MRTEQVEIFKYDELSDAAKESARSWYFGEGFEYHWSNEWIESLKGFAEQFPVKVLTWEANPHSYSSIGIETHFYAYSYEIDDNIRELSGVRAFKWLVNNGHDMVRNNGDKTLEKVINAVDGTCPFTGYIGDCSPLDPLADFLKKPDSRTLGELFQACADKWLKDFIADMEYQESDEYVAGHMMANEYEFTASGEFWG